jgi:hypothetical protein
VSGAMYQVYMALVFLFYKEKIMAFVTRFEDVQGWQEARKLVQMVYELTNSDKK